MLRQALKSELASVLWYAGGLAIGGFLIAVLYPSVRGSATQLEQSFNGLPLTVRQSFGLTGFTSLPAFIASEFLNFLWPATVSVFVILSGASTVAQEIERGTAEFWLSAPQSRARLLSAKLVALLAGIVVIVLATVAALVIAAAAIGRSLTLAGVAAVALVLASLGLAIGGYASLFSSFSNDRGRPAGIAAGLTIASYLAWIMAGLSARVSWLKHLSIFTAFQPGPALEHGSVDWLGILLLLLLGVASSATALWIFQRRDITV